MDKLKGVIIPIAVPLTEDYDLDPDGLGRLVEFLVGCKTDGIFANGSMGAFALLTDEVQYRVIEHVASCVRKRVPVLAGASETSTTRVLEKIRIIQELDVDCIVLLPPYYYPYQQKELLRFFLKAADFSQKPIILYENPKLTQNSISVDTISKLAAHPNILGIKFSAPDVLRWQELLRSPLPRDRFALICGAGKMTNLALRLGFDGITEGLHNIVPDLACSLYDASLKRDFDLADQLQQKINRCFRILEVDNGWRGLEVAFQYMGICRKTAVHPFDVEVEEKNRSRIVEVIEQEKIRQPFPRLLPETAAVTGASSFS